MIPTAPERQHYIDWVRVIAFFILIFFHCAMPFVIFGWEIKNAEHSIGLSRFIWWLHQWRLPLLFFISGAGIGFSLKRRSVLSFAGDRFVRLFIPVAFAMLFTIPLQVYYEWLQEGKIHQSYASFYPSVWKFVPYPDGSLTWSHMWYVVYLFVFCILLLPLFALCKIKAVDRLKQQVSAVLSNPVGLVLLALPLVYYYFSLFTKYPEQLSLVDDWFVFVFSLTLVLYGYLLAENKRFWECCDRYRWYFLGTAAACTMALFYQYWWNMEIPKQQGMRLYVYGILNSLHVWLLILAALGFAKRYLNFSNRFLRYTTNAVYPFYILHQTVIVAFGYYVVQWPLPVFVKLIILSILCFLTVWVLYHWLIRPFMLTRILFGLKPKEDKQKKSSLSEVNIPA